MTRVTGKVIIQGSTFSATATYSSKVGRLGTPSDVELPPTNGLVWYDTTTNITKVYIDGTGWIPVSEVSYISQNAPTSPAPGDIWYDTVNKQTNVYTPAGWYNVPTGTGITINGGPGGPAYLYAPAYESYITNTIGYLPNAYSQGWGDYTGPLKYVTDNGHTMGFDLSMSISAMTPANVFYEQGLTEGPDAIYGEVVVNDPTVNIGVPVFQVGIETIFVESAGGPGYIPPPFWQAFITSDGSMITTKNGIIQEQQPAGTFTPFGAGDAIGFVVQRYGNGTSTINWFINGVYQASTVTLDINMWFARVKANLGYNVVGYSHGPILYVPPVPPVATPYINIGTSMYLSQYNSYASGGTLFPVTFDDGPAYVTVSNAGTSLIFNPGTPVGTNEYTLPWVSVDAGTAGIFELQIGIESPTTLQVGVSKLIALTEGYGIAYDGVNGKFISFQGMNLPDGTILTTTNVPQYKAGDVIGAVWSDDAGPGYSSTIYIFKNGVMVATEVLPFSPVSGVQWYIQSGNPVPNPLGPALITASNDDLGNYAYYSEYFGWLNSTMGTNSFNAISSPFQTGIANTTYTDNNFTVALNYIPTSLTGPYYLSQASMGASDILTATMFEFKVVLPPNTTASSSLGSVGIEFSGLASIVWTADGTITTTGTGGSVIDNYTNTLPINVGDVVGLAVAGNSSGDTSGNYVAVFRNGFYLNSFIIPGFDPTNLQAFVTIGPNIHRNDPF